MRQGFPAFGARSPGTVGIGTGYGRYCLRNRLMASSVAGVKRLTRLPSGSRNRMERFPHGMRVGFCSHSPTMGWSRSYSVSTSSTTHSIMAVWLWAGRRC